MSGIGSPAPFEIHKFRKADGPLVDLRSPKEFLQGHWPGAINIPLFTNDERATIGTTYKHQGKGKAVLLGLKLTAPKLIKIKDSLNELLEIKEIKQKDKKNNSLRLYCWRGGMRSASVAWLAEIFGLNPIVLDGGYKSYRNWVLQQFERNFPIRLIGGRTGTGKTDLLIALAKKNIPVIDLEGLANHRGSSFGGLGLPTQPSTEHYENQIAEALENAITKSDKGIWLEAESGNLGKCRVPKGLIKQMKCAPMLELFRSKSERISQLVNVYSPYGLEELQEATLRISRRLGPQRTKQALDAISIADWSHACEAMLDYYDKCYEHELKKVEHRKTIDLTGLTSEFAAQMLIEKGLIC